MLDPRSLDTRSFVLLSCGPRATLAAALLGATLALGACSGDDESDTGTDAADAADTGDSAADVADADPDTADTGTDANPDTGDADGDTGADSGPDTADTDTADTDTADTADADDADTTDAEDTDDADTDDEDTSVAPLEVIGQYHDGYGGFARITAEGIHFSWYGPQAIAFTRYDNDANWVVGQNSPDDEWNPNQWSRFDWAPADGDLLWCQTSFSAATEDDAVAVAAADATDFDTGCGGFPWSRMTPGQGPVALIGEWDDSFGTTHEISNESWVQTFPGDPPSVGTFEITSYDNAAEVLIAQNSESNEWSPGLWSRFDWIYREGEFWVCQTAYDAASEESAEGYSRPDATDPGAGGCGVGPWTRLIAPL